MTTGDTMQTPSELTIAREIAGPYTTCKAAIIAGEHDDWAEVKIAREGLRRGKAEAAARLEQLERALTDMNDAVVKGDAHQLTEASRHATEVLCGPQA